MSYRVQLIPDGTLRGHAEWYVGVSHAADVTVAFIEESAVCADVLVDCWRSACSPQLYDGAVDGGVWLSTCKPLASQSAMRASA